MNRRWIIPLLVAAVAGAVAFGATRRLLCHGREAGVDGLRDVSFLTRALKLSADQAREIEALHEELGAKLSDCCARHCAARARLGAVLADDQDKGGGTEALLAEMCRAYEESERSTLDHMRHVRALLGPEQKKQFDAMLSGCLCGNYRTCGAEGGRPGPDVDR